MIINFCEELLEVYTPDVVVPTQMTKMNKRTLAVMTSIRTALAEAQGIAEELIPLEALAGFYREHASIALMHVEYPETELCHDALPWGLISVYRDTFQGEALPATCNESIRDKARSFYDRACEVAE